jgi:hypothetical protein
MSFSSMKVPFTSMKIARTHKIDKNHIDVIKFITRK